MSTTHPLLEFHLFPRLPTELRFMIWELCLPSRVIEMGTLPNLVAGSSNRVCRLHSTKQLLRSLPLIAQVCRESRRLVLRNGLRMADLYKTPEFREEAGLDHPGRGNAGLFCWAEDLETWVQPRRDYLHLHWGTEVLLYPYPSQRNEDPLVEFAALAKYGRVASVSISEHLVLNFKYSPGMSAGLWADPQYRELIPFLEQRREYYVVIKTIEIHVSLQAANKSGLFGHLGDAPIQLVDVRDHETIMAFRYLLLAYGEPDRDDNAFEDISGFPSFLYSSPGRHEETDLPFTGRFKAMIWQNQLRDNWIFHKAERERANGGNPPHHDQIWIPVDSEAIAAIPYATRHFPILGRFPTMPGCGTHRLNNENPWVKKKLEKMPAFRPVIMFRHCHRSVQRRSQ